MIEVARRGIVVAKGLYESPSGNVLKGFVRDRPGRLPVEFYNNELFEVDPFGSRDSEIFAFCETFGIPRNPCRVGRDLFDGACMAMGRPHYPSVCSVDVESRFDVSMSEARTAIDVLQWMVTAIRRAALGLRLRDWENGLVYSACLLSMADIEFGSIGDFECFGYIEPMFLCNAVCNQIMHACSLGFADGGNSWSVCGFCEKPFIFQSDSGKACKSKTDRKALGNLYCSARCYSAMKDTKKGKRVIPSDWDDVRIIGFHSEFPKSKLPERMR